MSARFGWVGRSRRQAACGRIADAARAWLAEWSLQDAAGLLIEEQPIMPLSPDEAHVLAAGTEGTAILVAVARSEYAALGAWLADADPATDLAQAVGRAALEDFASRLCALAGQGSAVADHGSAPWPLDLVREELGAVGIRVLAGTAEWVVVLARPAIDALCPPPERLPGLGLVPRQEAIDAASLGMRAVLDFGPVSVRELAGLEAGEVLVGECALDAPVHLVANGSLVELAQARLARDGERRAVTLIHTPQEQP